MFSRFVTTLLTNDREIFQSVHFRSRYGVYLNFCSKKIPSFLMCPLQRLSDSAVGTAMHQ